MGIRDDEILMRILLSLVFAIALLASAANAQSVKKSDPEGLPTAATAEVELKGFYDAYAEDLRQGRREAIVDRYDPRGYYSLGNGNKQFVTFAEAKVRYTTRWTPPKSFVWKDLTFEILSPDSATVVGLFDWEAPTGDKGTLSYS